jgi:hypothetical protein
MVLNYKKLVFAFLGLEPVTAGAPAAKAYGPKEDQSEVLSPPKAFIAASGWEVSAVPPERDWALAQAEFGDAPLERIELKAEAGGLLWKLKDRAGRELFVDAQTGAARLRRPSERPGKPGRDGQARHGTDWGKLILDLHPGRIGGEIGKAIVTGAGALLMFLSLSGVYLWLKPLLVRRANALSHSAGIQPATPLGVKASSLALAATAPRARPGLRVVLGNSH